MKLALSYLLLVASFSIQNLEAFQLPLSGGKVTSFVNPKCVSNRSSSASTFLCNVPPPSADDVETIKDSSDRESPPQSFYELQLSSAKAAKLAIKDGFKLLEVEFPPLPANVLEMDDVSAYDIAEANTKLAIDFAKSFAADGSKVSIMYPDEAEADIQIDLLGTKDPYPGVKISSLRRSDEKNPREDIDNNPFLSLFRGALKVGDVQAVENTDIYVILIASAQELPDVEELMSLDPEATIVFYNLKLDVLRGDLGAPAFPPKEFQDRFLSKVKPVYYLRTRQYSRSTAAPPYMVNYQGCLFRSYPGQFQTYLDTGNGRYRRVEGNDIRPALGEFKEQLTQALKGEGILSEEGNVLNFLRTGYKTTTWWEEERENASMDWRT